MKIIHAISAGLWLTAGGFLSAEPTVPASKPAAPTPAPMADPIAEALPILQAKYIDFANLHYKEGDRLSDLTARSDGRISLYMPETVVAAPILTAVLPDNIAYCRAGSFAPKKDWIGLAADINAMVETQHVSGTVIDLRGNASGDYAGAAQLLGFFVPNDTSLLKYVPQPKPGATPPAPIPALPHLDGPLIVLTNGQTAGAAEALAGCLKADGAIVVGRATAGTGFEEDKLSNGEILRFATALPMTVGDTMMRPVTPDLPLTVDDHNEKAALMLIREEHVLDVIQESAERKRMSEAALVNGQDPEWDAYLASLESAPVLLSLPRIHDPVLVTALDSVRAIRLSGSPTAAPVEPAGTAAQAAAANDAKPANTSVQ
jgi:hypothetical protein